MKPLLSETQDAETLQQLGRASVQIVHDLKNQLNGLKLYATFLRKRMEKSERPSDELETIAKLIAGLERAAGDMTALVRLGRPLELRRQPHSDLSKILTNALNGAGAVETGSLFNLEKTQESLEGAFDVAALTEAFKTINTGALNLRGAESSGPVEIHLRRDDAASLAAAIIEWRGVRLNDEADPFHSFAGSDGLRMALAAKTVEAHGGEATHSANVLRVRLPLAQSN
jgi:nitrogen fixation/metabolism regulation signal transduction histidine kinase